MRCDPAERDNPGMKTDTLFY
ncbi:MAG: hypothetical protein RLZZ511_3662, partial [Cyanobacteriota bacterium]